MLAVDAGGTTTRMALVRWDAGGPELVAERRESSQRWPGLEPLLRWYLEGAPARPAAAGVAVAGPVRDGACRATNLPWLVETVALERALGCPVTLVNDLEALAWALPWLPGEAFATVFPGAPGAAGNLAVVGVGTGLGVAGLVWDGARHLPFATEAGHAGFAPADEAEWGLVRELSARYGRASRERVVSGPGLVELARLEARRTGARPGWLGDGDPAAVSRAAAAADPVAVAAVGRFVRALGRVAGDVALELGAAGGVVLAGGVALRLRRWLEGPAFREAFLAKGRMRPLMERVPVRLLLEERAGLLGAARRAVAGPPPIGGGDPPSGR